MKTLCLPHPGAGLNDFTAEPWWAEVLARATTTPRPTATTIAIPDVPDTVPQASSVASVLLVARPVAEALPTPTTAAVEEWSDRVRSAAAEHDGPVHLAVSATTVGSLDELVTLAAGHRWPPYDAVAAAAHPMTDPLPVPAVAGGGDAARAFAEAVVRHVDLVAPPSWTTGAEASAAAAASVARSLDAVAAVPAVLAHELRAACRAALASFEQAGITISGPRDALLWPVPAERGRIPLDVVADAAEEAMRSMQERPGRGLR